MFFNLLIQNIHAETRHSRLPQASEQCFRKTPNNFKKSLVQEGGMFGVLRKHRSEACGRRLCLVFNNFQSDFGDQFLNLSKFIILKRVYLSFFVEIIE